MVSSGSMRCRKAWLLFECCCSTFLYLSETLNVVVGLLALVRVRIRLGCLVPAFVAWIKGSVCLVNKE